MMTDATAHIRAFIASLERSVPTPDTEDVINAILEDRDIDFAFARDDAICAANALRAVVLRICGADGVPRRIARALRDLNIPLHIKRED